MSHSQAAFLKYLRLFAPLLEICLQRRAAVTRMSLNGIENDMM